MGAKLLLRRWRESAVLAVMACVLAATVVVGSTIPLSVVTAQRTGVEAQLGGLRYALQSEPSAESVLRSTRSLVAVTEEQMSVSARDGRVDGLVRRTNRPGLGLAPLTAGRAPRSETEIALSVEAGAALGVGLGDQVRVGDLRHRVVGLAVNPAARAEVFAFGFSRAAAASATSWLSSQDPYAEPSLRPAFERREVTYQSVATLARSASEAQPEWMSALRVAPLGLGALMLVMLLWTLAAFGSLGRRLVSQLGAAGLTDRGAWRLVTGAAVAACLTGLAVGAVLGWAALRLCRDVVASWFGQVWLDLPIGRTAVLFTVGTAGFLLVSRVLLLREISRRAQPRAPRPPRAVGRGAVAAVGALGGVLLLVALGARLRDPPAGLVTLALPASALLASAAVGWVVLRASASSSPAMSKVLGRVVGRISFAATVAALIATAASAYSAGLTHHANAGEGLSGLPQPPGSLVVTEVPRQSAAVLATQYTKLGGDRPARYLLADESTQQVRATGSRLVTCLSKANTLDPESVDPGCFPQETYAPTNLIAMYDGDTAIADPTFVENGSVGILVYATDGDAVPRRVATTDAKPSRGLGGNLPGLVIPADGDTARRLGLKPGGRQLLVFSDFGRLDSRTQASWRATVAKVAPGAQSADASRDQTYQQERTGAAIAGLGGAAIVGAIAVLSGLALVIAERPLRRTMVDLGGLSKKRHVPSRRVLLVLLAPAVCGIPLALLGAYVSGTRAPGGYGYVWLLPFVVVAASSIAIAAAFRGTPEYSAGAR